MRVADDASYFVDQGSHFSEAISLTSILKQRVNILNLQQAFTSEREKKNLYVDSVRSECISINLIVALLIQGVI